MPRQFGECRFIGRIAADCERLAEHSAPERLRRLREKDAAAIQSRLDDASNALLDRVARFKRGKRRA